MSTPALLLAVDAVTLYPAGPADVLGWSTGTGTAPVWSGTGNLQLSAGVSDPRASEGGGFGPFAPARVESGVLYLPDDAQPADGMTADVRGARWVLSQVRLVADPTGGPLTCWAATVTRDKQFGLGSG